MRGAVPLPCLLVALIAASAAVAHDDGGARDRTSITSASRFVGFTATQRAWIAAVVDRAPSPARNALARVSPFITFRRGAPHEISQGDHTSTFVGTTSVRFLVSLGWRTRAVRDSLAAHMLMHELGHTVDNGLVDEALRASFGELFTHSPAWTGCFVQPLGSSQRCVHASEIFAEQFGYYGSRDRLPRSLFNIPPLYRFRDFGALLQRATGRADTLLGSEHG